MRRVAALAGHRWFRLGSLLAILAALVVYAIGGSGLRAVGLGSEAASAGDDCPAAQVPPLAKVPRSRLLDQIHLFERIGAAHRGTPYEWGPADTGYPWSDEEPGVTRLPAEAMQPGGYEMRWWLPDRSDVSIDGFSFEDAGAAQEYLELAASAECRTDARASDAGTPTGARHLSWVNPDAVAQEDVFMRSGRSVYRVSAVVPGAGDRVTPTGREAGFRLIDELACALPGGECLSGFGEPS